MANIISDENGNEIKFRPNKFTVRQTAEELDVKDSAIRYWTEKFYMFLDVNMEDRKKEYNGRDIFVLEFIKRSTREDKLTIEQVYKLLEEQYGYISNAKFKTSEEVLNQEVQDVAINTIVDNRIVSRLNDFKNEFKAELVEDVSNAVEDKLKNALMQHFASIEDMIKGNQLQSEAKLNEIKSEIATTVIEEVSSTVTSSIENSSKSINETLGRIEEATKERDLKQAEEMKRILDQRKKENDELIASLKVEQESKGFFARMFGK